MLDRLTRLQLSIFAIVTVLTVGAISTFYLHLPAAVGIGSYKVTANFVAGGGLYENANVTYRGVTVGRVESVNLTNDGVVAHMRLNSDTRYPNVTATVKSVSAVGEQYIDLVPPGDYIAGRGYADGSNITRSGPRSTQDIAESAARGRRIGSSSAAIPGSRTCCARRSRPSTVRDRNWRGLIQSSRLLIEEANASLGRSRS